MCQEQLTTGLALLDINRDAIVDPLQIVIKPAQSRYTKIKFTCILFKNNDNNIKSL